MQVDKLLQMAARVAKIGSDNRKFCVGAVAIRRDGVFVCARNGAPKHKVPHAHAEARVLRKAGKGAILFVARCLRSGGVGMAKPCATCEAACRARGVKRAYYTTEDGYGCVSF